MKIKYATQDRRVPFEDVEIGEVFKFCNGYYLKMDEACDNTGSVVANAVNLINGDIKEFTITEIVIPVDSELYVNR